MHRKNKSIFRAAQAIVCASFLKKRGQELASMGFQQIFEAFVREQYRILACVATF